MVILIYCLQSSFARYMSRHGFDTWILEVRGAGLSKYGLDFGEAEEPLNEMIDSSFKHGTVGVFPSRQNFSFDPGAYADSDLPIGPIDNGKSNKSEDTVSEAKDSKLVSKFMKTFLHLLEKFSGLLNEGWSRKFPLAYQIEV